MNTFGGLFVLFTYFQFSKLTVRPTVPTNETQTHTLAKFSSGRLIDIDQDAIEGTSIGTSRNDRRIILDLKDIDLKLFDVTDEYYSKYLTKYIKLKDHTNAVKIVEGDVLLHEPKTGEKYMSSVIRANSLDLYLRYEFRDAQANVKTIIYYKANDAWYTLPSESTSDPLIPFESDKCSLDSILRESEEAYGLAEEFEEGASEDSEGPEESDLTKYSHNVDSLYIKFVLDINSKEENEKVNFRECHIQDNHSLVYIIKRGYRVSSVREGRDLVCEIPEGTECFFLQVLLQKEEPKFVLAMSKDGSRDVVSYYEKIDGKWEGIKSEDYYRNVLNCKSQYDHKIDMELDIRLRKDTNEVLFIDSDYDNVHTHIYTPMPGYAFKKIKIKDHTIWKRKEDDCQMVMVRFLHNYPNKVHLVMPSNVSDLYYHLKKKYVSYSVRRSAKSIKFEGEFDAIDEKKYSEEIGPLRFQPPIKFPSNKFVVDIREKRDCEIYMFRQGTLMGVETRFYMAKDGYKIALVREGDSEVWKSSSSEFASFVVVLLSQNSVPVLARVVEFDEDIQSKHRYFIKANSRWKEIDSLKYRSGLEKLCTFASRLGVEEERRLTVDLSKNYETGELISMRYHFDGMDTKVLMPSSKVKIQSVMNKGHLIWEKGEHECVMVICRLNGNKPYFVNIVKAGGTSDEFFYESTLQAKDESNDWKKVIFDHIYVQIKESRVKPYIQHSYKEHQIDVSAERHDEACVHKTGDFYNIPSSYYIMKTGHGITRVLDRGKEIWRSNNGEYSPYLVMLYDQDKPRLLFVMINKPSYEINEITTAYLEKKEEGWEPMYGDVEFNFVLNKMEVKDKRAQKFELDIDQRGDDERVLCFEDKFGVRNIILYFPKKNYRLVKLKDGEDVIMETGSKDYIISVKMYVVGKKPYLIRIRYRHEEMRFKDFERIGSSWVEIDYNAFLIKTLTLNDVFLSEVNVLKSSLFDKEYTKLGSDKRVPEEDLARKIKNRLDNNVHFESIDKDAVITPVERIFELISEKVKTDGDEWLYVNGGGREEEECVLDIRNIDLDKFTFRDNVYKETLHRVVENKNECKVIKVKEEDEDIHDIKEGQKLFRCHIYNREGRNEVVDIFTHDENHRLNYMIYAKREGVWEKSYWRTSDLLYKLYRYMSRPVKKHVALDLSEIDEQNFQVEEKKFASYSHKTISPNSDVRVNRVAHQNELVQSMRGDQTLVWCSYNEMGLNDDVLDLFVTDLDGKLYCYSYKRDSEGWSLNYTHKSTVSSLEEFASRRFKALVSHRLIDTCDGEVLDEAEKEDVELNIDSHEATVEYTLNSTHCKMFRPKKSQKVTKIYDGGQELLNANVLKTKALLASFLYLKDGDKSVLYVFLVDEDGNVERIKYYRVSDKWVISYKAPESYKQAAYELDNVSNKDVIEYLDDSFNCKFTKDLESAIAEYESNPTMKPYLRPPIWILDVNNVDKKKFKVTRSTKDSRECSHIAPKPFVLVDRIVYNDEIIHDLTPGDMLDSVTVTVDKDDEYEITCDIESPDGTLTTYARKSNEPEPSRMLYTPTSRSLYRRGNLYEMAGSHVINIANLTNEHCVLKSTLLKGQMIKKFTVNDDLVITRVFEGVRLINIVRTNYKLVSGTVFYYKGPAMIILKCKSQENGYYRSVYVKLEFEWTVIGEGETERYLRSLYPDGKYFTAPEIKDLLE